MNAINQNYHPGQRQASPHPATPPSRHASSTRWGWVIGGIIIALILLAAVLFGVWYFVSRNANAMGAVETNHYQAVFLTNNQVYFGKIQSISGDTMKITNIYYLQANQTTPQTNNNANNNPQTTQNQNLSLVKLGSELHAPEDVMYISRKQVLFWENLKDDGKVVQAIKNNQSK